MPFRPALRHAYRLTRPVLDLRAVATGLVGYTKFFAQLRRYSALPGAEPEEHRSLYPVFGENTAGTSFDAHYLYLGDWALRSVVANPAPEHVDVASQLHWVVAVAAFKPITFIDIRPAEITVRNLCTQAGSLMSLPFKDREVRSLSCLHVIEHVGLGRYGDPLDPGGSKKAALELARVLAPGGTLLLALPVGRPHLAFNAHRVHTPATVQGWMESAGLQLKSFAAVDDDGRYLPTAEPVDVADCRFGCGLFEFVR